MSIERQFKARTRTASVSTVIGITLVLVMLGFQGFVLLNASAVERYFKENVRVELFLKRDLKEVDVMRFRKELDTEAFTRETRYVTADEAAEQLKQDLGEDFLGVLGSNPLLPSVELNVDAAYAQPDSMKWIVEHLKSDRRVQEVAYNAAVPSAPVPRPRLGDRNRVHHRPSSRTVSSAYRRPRSSVSCSVCSGPPSARTVRPRSSSSHRRVAWQVQRRLRCSSAAPCTCG